MSDGKKTKAKLRLIKVIQEEIDVATVTVAGHERLYDKNIDFALRDLDKIKGSAEEVKEALESIRSKPESTDLPSSISAALTRLANLRARLRGIEEKFQENERKKQ